MGAFLAREEDTASILRRFVRGVGARGKPFRDFTVPILSPYEVSWSSEGSVTRTATLRSRICGSRWQSSPPISPPLVAGYSSVASFGARRWPAPPLRRSWSPW